jgi:hypothetical protein
VAVTRTIITAGLAIRAREKIRVRQPLPRARVALSTAIDISKQIDAVAQELNVKAIEIVRATRRRSPIASRKRRQKSLARSTAAQCRES